MMGSMVAVQFFHVAALGAALLVFAAFIALVLWWREEGTRARQRSRNRARHTTLNTPAPTAPAARPPVDEEVELSA
jgi:HAMP domain-containing protein